MDFIEKEDINLGEGEVGLMEEESRRREKKEMKKGKGTGMWRKGGQEEQEEGKQGI